MKYVVYKQPLSLDRFFIHEVSTAEANMAKLENAFILINLNRFQQIVSVQTFQAESEQQKVNEFSFFYTPLLAADLLGLETKPRGKGQFDPDESEEQV